LKAKNYNHQQKAFSAFNDVFLSETMAFPFLFIFFLLE